MNTGFLLELLGDLHWTFVSVGIVSSMFFAGLVLRARWAPGPDEAIALPPLSILKPFDGVDPEMDRNFWSYLATPYAAPREILFCTAHDNVAGIAAARGAIERLRAEPQPGVTARLLVSEPDDTPWVTRKVWHMARGYAACSHDVIVNGDSGTRLAPGVLDALVRTLLADPGRGAAWAPYTVSDARSLGARLTRVAWTATTMNFLVVDSMHRFLRSERPLLAGGLFAARRSAIDQLDGFAQCDGFLTEDLEVGRRISASGMAVVRSPVPVQRHLGGLTLGGFYRRQLRWNTILWRFRDPLRIPYPLVMCGLAIAPFTCAAACLAFPGRVREYLSALAALYVVRWVYSLFLSVVASGGQPRLETLLLLPWVDAVMLETWVRGAFVRTITWRGRSLRVERGGRVTPVQERRGRTTRP